MLEHTVNSMTISKTTRTCLVNTRDDINSTVREINARIDSHYYQALGHGYKNVVSQALAHGVPTQVPNPLKSFATPFGAIALNCDTQALPSLTTSLYSNGIQAASGYIWVTANYPLAEQFLLLQQVSVATPLASGATVVLPFTATKSVGSNISFDGTSTVTFKAAARYLMAYQFIMNGSGASVGSQQAQVLSNGVNWGRLIVQITPALPTICTSAIITAAAGSTAQLTVLQSSGGTLSTFSSASDGCRLELSQLSNDASLTANVTFSLLAP